MSEKSFSENAKTFALKRVLSYMDANPEQNAVKIVNWLDQHDKHQTMQNQLRSIKKTLDDPENNWYQLIMSLWTDIDGGQRRALFESLVINDSLIGTPKQRKLAEKYDCNVPWAILMDPTSACNLHCTGCWAAEYGNKLNLSVEQLDSVIRQGKELGIYLYIYSGGEPLVRKDDIIKLCEMHPDCAFLAFTNATLIDEAFGNEMLRVKNFVPAISIEGFEKETDFRRGAGTYQKILKAMEILRRKKLLFGVSCCYTSKNVEVIGSEAYFDDIIAKGAKFAWFFTYMPVGKDAVPELMASAEQREHMYHAIRAFRDTKPLFTMDFWNDAEYVKGCIAGGRSYLHINANGDVEPCAFIHYSDTNIKENTLLEALQGPLFMQYHKHQPFNENMLRPCPLLDNEGELAQMVESCAARSTDLQNPEDVQELCGKCAYAAEHWAPVAQKLWEATRRDKGTKRCQGGQNE